MPAKATLKRGITVKNATISADGRRVTATVRWDARLLKRTGSHRFLMRLVVGSRVKARFSTRKLQAGHRNLDIRLAPRWAAIQVGDAVVLSLTQQYDRPRDGDRRFERNFVSTTTLQSVAQPTPPAAASRGCSRVLIRPSANLRNCSLRHAYLPNTDLARARLSGADLSRASLYGTKLSGANLSGAELSRANLARASLSGANLSGAGLFAGRLVHVRLRDANLTGANLTHARLVNADLAGADLTRGRLTRALMTGADLSGARMPDSQLRGTYLNRADLSGANLSRANLTCRAKGPNMDPICPTLLDADLSGAILREATLRGVDLRGADLQGADLSGAVCSAGVRWTDGEFVPDPPRCPQ